MLDVRLFMLQRLTALIMAPLTLVHLAVMIYAIQGGLSAGEILGRTQGSIFWFLFYGLFVLSVSIHAAIGLKVIVSETFKVRGTPMTVLSWAFFLIALYLGSKAVIGVTLS